MQTFRFCDYKVSGYSPVLALEGQAPNLVKAPSAQGVHFCHASTGTGFKSTSFLAPESFIAVRDELEARQQGDRYYRECLGLRQSQMELRKASKPERRAIAEELLGEEVVQTGVLFAPDFQKYRLTAIDPYYADLHAHNPRTALSFVVTGNFDPAKTMMAMGQMIGVIHPESNPKFDINALPLQLPGAHRTIGVQVSLKSDYYTALMVMRLFNPAIHEACPDIPSITLHTIDLGAELAPYNLYFTLSTSNSAVLPMASRVTTGNIDNLWNVELDQAGLQQMDVFREEGDPGAELEKNLRAFFYQLDKPQPASTEVSSDATRPLLPDPGAN